MILEFTLRMCSWLTCLTGTPSQHIHRDFVKVYDDMIPQAGPALQAVSRQPSAEQHC